MKKILAIILSAWLCAAVGCGGNVTGDHATDVQAGGRSVSYEEPVYQIDITTNQEQFTSEDGTPLLAYSYQLLSLAVPNLDALSSEDKAAAELNIESFNAQMAQRMAAAEEFNESSVGSAQAAYDDGYRGGEYIDETTAAGIHLGQIISVRIDNYSYFGGAHPNRYTDSLTFDLSSGRFIDPAQLADDPEAFRTGIAELLVGKADAMGEEYVSGYWTDYRDIIAHWNEGAVLFDETGMTVVYSPYEIGPYAMGEVALTVSCQELEPLIGPGGMEKLGLALESVE